jgi:serine/threonine protein kinase
VARSTRTSRTSRSRTRADDFPAAEVTGGGRLLAGRYQLTGRPLGTGVAATDVRSGARVQLDAVPLPELVDVSAEPFDHTRGPVQPQAPFQAGTEAEVQAQAAAPESSPASDGTSGRALRQAAYVAAGVPDHPRLSQVFQVFEENGYLWVAGEAVPGVPLSALLQRGPLPPYRAAELAHDLVAALGAVHATGLVHGNLTAETVTVCEDGTALLAGLVTGVAQEALCGGPGAERPGAEVPAAPWSPSRARARDARAVIVGPIPERWAPEQLGPVADRTPGGAAPGLPVGPAADAWALGVLLYRVLTGDPPFPQSDTESLFDAVRTGEPEAFTATRHGERTPPTRCGPLGSLVERLLRPDPAERPTLPEIAARVRALLERAPEPIEQDDMLAVAALLPVQRRRGEVLEHPDFPHHRHAAPRPRARLLGPLLVGGILFAVGLALFVAVLAAR